MATIVWPPSLPQSPMLEDLVEQPPDLALRSSVDRGPAKVRLRSLADVTRFSIGLKLTRAQVATLDTFYRTTSAGGTLAFEWIHHRTGNQIDYRFTEPPAFKPLAPRQSGATEYWRADFAIESIPGTEVVAPSPPPPPPPPPPPGGGDSSFGLLLIDESDAGEPGSWADLDATGGFFDVPIPEVAAAADTITTLFALVGADIETDAIWQDEGGFDEAFLQSQEPGTVTTMLEGRSPSLTSPVTES